MRKLLRILALTLTVLKVLPYNLWCYMRDRGLFLGNNTWFSCCNRLNLIRVLSNSCGGSWWNKLLGGRGSFYPGSFIGALILLFIASGMAIMGISPYAIPFVRGIIIFIAMYIDSLRYKSIMSLAS